MYLKDRLLFPCIVVTELLQMLQDTVETSFSYCFMHDFIAKVHIFLAFH